MAGKLKKYIIITAMAILFIPLALHAQSSSSILIASSDASYLLANSDPQYLIANANTSTLLANADYQYLLANTSPALLANADYSYLIASSNSSYMLANSTPNLYAGYISSPIVAGIQSSGYMTYAPPVLLGQYRGYMPFLYNGIYQPIIPIERQTSRTSWFTYGYGYSSLGSRQKSIIHMYPILTGMRLRYEFRDQTRKSRSYESKQSGNYFTEQINFTTKGWIYTPNLLKYTLFFSPKFAQIVENNDGKDLNDNYFAPDFRTTLTAFDNKPLKLHFHGSHNNNTIWVLYTGSAESKVDSVGGDAELDLVQTKHFGQVFSNLGYDYTKTKTDGFYEYSSRTHNVWLESSQKSSRSQGNFNIKFTDIDRTRLYDNNTEDRIQYKTLDTLLTHLLYLSDLKQSNLQTNASYITQDFGNTTYQFFGLGSGLYLVHSPTFRTRYKLGYKRYQSDNTDGTDTYNSEVSLTHRLYDNLFTDAGILAEYEDRGINNVTDINPRLSFNYTRDIPWGLFSIKVGWDYKATLRDGLAGGNLFHNEQFSAHYGVDTTLAHENIDTGSIIVSGLYPARVFTENIDYEIETIGNRTILRILPLGDIKEGEEISVQYTYSIDFTYDSSFFTQHYGFNFQLFNMLYLDYLYTQATEDILSGTAPGDGRLADNSTHHAKARLDFWWTRSEITYDIDKYNDDTTKSLYLSETLNIPLFERGDLDLNGSWGNTQYDSVNGDTTYYGTSFTFRWRFANWCNLAMSGYYQKNDSPSSYDTINSGLRTTLNFYYRIWQASLYWEYLSQEQKGNDMKRESNLIRLDLIRLKW